MRPTILQRFQLELHWKTQEPFLFCAYHKDAYPAGTPQLGPDPKLLEGRNLGEDFELRDGFRMYHGEVIPGFPVHPHRGFETVTLVREGYIDHADSMGAIGRYGPGDVQWMTAGRGVQHSEMFPLLRSSEPNNAELFQIWLNLPQNRKMSPPDFKMLWRESIPVVDLPEQKARITLISGNFGDFTPPSPPEASWASDPRSETVIWLIHLDAGGWLELPASRLPLSRSLYFYQGTYARIAGESFPSRNGVFLDAHATVQIEAGSAPAELLLLQSRKIGETIVQYGPFVMNTKEEIYQTVEEFKKTEFGGWPWDRPDMIHGSEIRRFARYPDGRVETPGN